MKKRGAPQVKHKHFQYETVRNSTTLVCFARAFYSDYDEGNQIQKAFICGLIQCTVTVRKYFQDL